MMYKHQTGLTTGILADMNLLSSFQRSTLLQKLNAQVYDVVIIGGGATGSGIALDAASRGLSTALLEMQDFAAGTSSRSTKLIHGGLRYLKQFEIALVREVGRERAIVHRLAPHLVVSEKMLLPLIKGGTYGKLATSVGLMVYDVLAGVESADQRIMLSKEETLEKEPLLREDVLEGSGFYAEYRTDDARLTIELIKTAAKYGADSVNYVQATEFLYDIVNDEEKKIVGVVCKDLLTHNTFEIKAKCVVNAAGPWVDEIRGKDNSVKGKYLHLTKGVHLVVSHEKFPVRQSVYFDLPDGRMIFAIPRGNITYIGTTDTEYHGNKENPRTNKEDVDYLINGTKHVFPHLALKPEDVVSSWAGLRPLIHEEGKSASEISRKDEIFVSHTGLISIAGGKLTGYRKMAERTVDKVFKLSQKNHKKCRTDQIVLNGGEFADGKAVEKYKKLIAEKLAPYDLPSNTANYLVSNYGKQVGNLLEWILARFEEVKDIELAVILGELDFTLTHEMVHTPLDFFSRRTGRLYFDIESVRKHMEAVLEVFQVGFSWSDEKLAEERKALEMAVYEASHFPPIQEVENQLS